LATLLAGTAALAAPPGSQSAAATPGHGVISQAPVPKPGTGNFVERLIGELRSSGLEVSVGYPKLWTEADCAYNYPVYHNCFGNNPAAPYVLLVVKSWPEEYVDPAMANGMVRTRPGYSATYRLDPREAIIVFGRMPPPARYMGLQTYIWTTGWVNDDPPSPWDPAAYGTYESIAGEMTQYFFATFPPANYATDHPVYGDRVQSFSSIDNNINNVVMEEQSGSPWDEFRYFVITPDQLTDEAVRTVLGSLGVDQGEIFTEGIPQTFEDLNHVPPYPYGQNRDVGPLGLDEGAVDFLTGLRYAMPEDEHAANAWRKSLLLTVLRVRPFSGRDPEPFDEPLWADARPTVDEREVDDGALRSGLSSLIDAVIARAESQGLHLYLDTTNPEKKNPEEMIDILNELGQFGPACREIGMNCLGDGQDASYFMAPPNPLDTGRIYAVVGTLAIETGNGTYVGLSVNDPSLLKGVLNVNDTQLKGSAGSYESAVSNWDKFFVHFFTRDCAAIAGLTDGACTTITKQMIPLADDDKAPGDADLHGKFSAGLRAYVVPNYERGPDPTLQLTPMLITFTRDSP
jgi:hypothetical protein